MSGPKGYQVTVVSPVELERRALIAALVQRGVVTGRADRLRREMAAALARGVAIPDHAQLSAALAHASAPRTSDACVSETRRLGATCEQVERALSDHVGRHRARLVVAELASTVGTDDDTPLEVTPVAVVRPGPGIVLASSPDPGAQDGRWREEVAASVERNLARLGDADSEAWETVRRTASTVLAQTSSAAAHQALMILQDEVSTARRRQQARLAFDRARAELTARIEEIGGERGTFLHERLADVTRAGAVSGIPPAFVDAVARAEEEVRVEADRVFALAVAAECLAELGYEVDMGFSTLTAQDAGYAQRADWSGYAVQVQTAAGSNSLRFNVVRAADAPTSAAQDAATEAVWCADVEAAQQRALAHGLRLDLVRAKPPGALPLQVVAPERVRRRRRRPLAEGAPIARSLGGTP